MSDNVVMKRIFQRLFATEYEKKFPEMLHGNESFNSYACLRVGKCLEFSHFYNFKCVQNVGNLRIFIAFFSVL